MSKMITVAEFEVSLCGNTSECLSLQKDLSVRPTICLAGLETEGQSKTSSKYCISAGEG